jgi:hypothetical protein
VQLPNRVLLLCSPCAPRHQVPCSASQAVPRVLRVVGTGTHRGSGPREVHTTRTCTKNPPREKTKLSEVNQPRIRRTNFKRPNGIGRFNPRRSKSRFIRRQGTGTLKGWKAKVKVIEALARSPVLHLPHVPVVDLPVGAGHVDLGGAVVAGEVRSPYSRRRRRMESSGRRKGVESTLVGERPRSPHALVAKVPPPSRRVCSRRGGGAGAKGWRVCGTHLSARVVMALPAECRGGGPRRATLPLLSF